MPIVTMNPRRTDPGGAPWWPWLAVVLGLSLLWVLFGVLVSYGARRPSDPAAGLRGFYVQEVTAIEQLTATNQFALALARLEGIPSNVDMDAYTRHRYYQAGIRSARALRSPKKERAFLQQFLRMAARLEEPECAACHRDQPMPPRTAADLLASENGARWGQLTAAAPEAAAVRRQLVQSVEQAAGPTPELALLFHLDTAAKRDREAARWSRRLRETQ